MIFLEIRWHDPSRDALYTNIVDDFIARGTRKAKQMGILHPFIYMNYASEGQQVYSSYGKYSMDRFRKVRDQYDPDRLFTIVQAGSFKLD